MARRATTRDASRQDGCGAGGGSRLVLASGSPRRLELLSRVGLVPEVVSSDVEEVVRPGEAADGAALRLAGEKAADVAGRLGPAPAFVIAADTIVALGGEVLGKPLDAADAARMLDRLSGRTHAVHTGFVVLALPLESGGLSTPPCRPDRPNGPPDTPPLRGQAKPGRSLPRRVGHPSEAGGGRRIERVVTTRVRVKRLTPLEIAGYVATGEPLGKAGGYAVQGAGAFMVERVDGSVTNVIGLPLVEVLEALAALGGPRPFGGSAG